MDLKNKFLELYGGEPRDIHEYFAPGRVNLIGEHIDYNGGKVFPCALDLGTWAAVSLRDDEQVAFASLNLPLQVQVSLSDMSYREKDGWANYAKGVIQEFQARGCHLKGMNILVYGTIPNGSGLSSSASLEVLTAVALNHLFQCGFSMVEMVQMCQHAENTYVGVNCGIMDQFAVGMGREAQAILLDCNTLDYQYAPLKLGDAKLVIGNTKKRRGLADSKYNERRGECEAALQQLQGVLSISSLCELTPAEFDAHQGLIQDETCRRRARHAVYENQRVLEAVQALEAGNIQRFGQLMNESHDSLRDLYEVTGPELDAMVEEARAVQGTLGSRMTGAGFGGCTVSIVRADAVEAFIEQVGQRYEQRTGLKPEFYVAQVGKGAGPVYAPAAYQIEELLAYALDRDLIQRGDVVYCRNALLDLLQLEEPWDKVNGILPCQEAVESMADKVKGGSPEPILQGLLEHAYEIGLFPENTTTYRDLWDARIMGIFTARPSDTEKEFRLRYEQSPAAATDYFYHQAQDSHYIMTERVAKNLYWKASTPYGDLEITVNLSKPEKDPREIAKLKFLPSASYPKCMLCPENVGYAGRLNHPARQNLRQISRTLDGENWYFQYSPYVYYQEHCIVLKEEHVPMKISEATFRRLFDFIEWLPHYFLGSNAGLPVVGGSILNHEHYQGGHHVFPMEKAAVRWSYSHPAFDHMTISVIHWQMSAIRISGASRQRVIALAAHILHSWEAYEDTSVGVYAYTEKDGVRTPHNAITPIARFNAKGEYELDLVLRNNRTSEEFPDGIFHPHPRLHHIKKENIGLIEVMGLAVLPGRLDKELSLISQLLTGAKVWEDFSQGEQEALEKHVPWITDMQSRYGQVSTEKEADAILKKEVGEIFSQVLECSGVFKNTEEGYEAFERFMASLGCVRQS